MARDVGTMALGSDILEIVLTDHEGRGVEKTRWAISMQRWENGYQFLVETWPELCLSKLRQASYRLQDRYDEFVSDMHHRHMPEVVWQVTEAIDRTLLPETATISGRPLSGHDSIQRLPFAPEGPWQYWFRTYPIPRHKATLDLTNSSVKPHAWEHSLPELLGRLPDFGHRSLYVRRR